MVAAPSEATRRRAYELGARTVVDDLEALPSVAGIVVATPTVNHADTVDAALERRVPVFCEKPLTTDTLRARQLLEKGGGRLFVMDKWRYHPGVERLAELARENALGPVVGLHSVRLQPGSPHTDVDPVWILAPHDLMIAREILGHIPQPRAATAEYHEEALVGLTGVLGDAPWVAFEVSARYPTHRREVRLLCRHGSALLSDAYSSHLCILVQGRFGGAYREERLSLPDDMPLLKELRAFVDHVQGGPAPRSSAEDAVVMIEALTRLRELAGVVPADA